MDTPNELDVYVRVYTDPAKRGEQTAILRDRRAQIPVAAVYVECGPIAIEIAYVGPASPDRTAAAQQLAQPTTAADTGKSGPC